MRSVTRSKNPSGPCRAGLTAGAILAELESGRLRAALDVTDPEPLPSSHPLWNAPGLLLTPHIGGGVPGVYRRAARMVSEQLGHYLRGEELPNLVRDGY